MRLFRNRGVESQFYRMDSEEIETMVISEEEISTDSRKYGGYTINQRGMGLLRGYPKENR